MNAAAGSPLPTPPDLPYVDLLLQRLEKGDPGFSSAFARHMHWGSWADPSRADGSVADFAAAAERLSLQLISAAAIGRGDRILDAGCGLGGTLELLNASGTDLELTGLNIDPRQLARAAGEVVARSGTRIHWLAGDACAMPLSDASFDVVLAVECIFHFPSREAFFAEVARVLRPGGRLVLCDFVPTRMLRLLQTIRPGMSRAVVATYGRIDCSCTLAGYRSLARRHGLNLRLVDDITRSTLPTYPVVEGLFRTAGWPEAAAATGTIARVSRWGLLRYLILAFELESSPGGGVNPGTP